MNPSAPPPAIISAARHHCRRPTAAATAVLLLLCLLPLSPAAGAKVPKTQRPYTINSKTYYPIPSAKGYRKQGVASWYGPGFHGNKTSNGETYNMHAMTAAHKTLPMNTTLLVRNLENGKKVVVRINDRGPFVRGRIIDLSRRAAEVLGILGKGTARVELVALAEARNGAANLVYEDILHGEYFVQIGAFRLKNNARKLAKRFNKAGHHTVIYPWRKKTERRVYRLLVYVGDTLAKAEKAERLLRDKGYRDAFIIRWDKKTPLEPPPEKSLQKQRKKP